MTLPNGMTGKGRQHSAERTIVGGRPRSAGVASGTDSPRGIDVLSRKRPLTGIPENPPGASGKGRGGNWS